MTSERHATVMGAQMGAMPVAGSIARFVPVPSPRRDVTGQEGNPVTPRSVLGDCPAQQAIPPLILLLLLLIVLLRILAAWPCADSAVRTWCRRFTLPPPLNAARRRALLQVFLI